MQWFPGDVSMAIQVSRKNKALLVVYISSDSPDGKIFDEFWQQIDSNNLLCPVVGIKLKEGETAAKQFADIYPTPILPAAYLIDHEGKPIEVITSLVGKTYDAFRTRFDRGTASFVNAIGKNAPSQPAEAQSAPRVFEHVPPPPPVDTNPTSGTAASSTQNNSENGQALNPELAEKVARAKKLLELKKHRDAERQKESEKKQREEMARASEAKRARDDKAIAEAAKLRKKEKEEAQKEKERILAQIKADREDAQKRFNASKNTEPVAKKTETAETSVGKSILSDRCRLQIRLPDGSTFVEEFPSNDVLNSLIAIIQQKPSIAGSSFEVHQPYPRRVFTVADYSKTFLENQLTPSTALVVVLKPSTASTISKAVSTQSSSLFSLILSPFFLVWNIFTGMLGFNKPAEGSKKNEGTSSGAARSSGASGTQQRGMPRSAEVRRRGNVAGLENPNDDDPEERANFNGNSTQFM